MDSRDSRGAGWQTFSGLVLALGGIFAVIDGLMAVYKSTFFVGSAVFVFSDLKTWGWITFALGVLAFAAGIAVFSGREWARWTGIGIAGLAAVGQLLTAQAYPLWSLMLMGIFVLAGYGLAVYGVRDSYARSSGYRSESTPAETGEHTSGISEVNDRERRAA
ncbi:MAG TPA: hypothetical protein VMH50_10785 [Thermoleophilia bacterium]|nr:hypothetical protein [Thermoleophilia bacterium]